MTAGGGSTCGCAVRAARRLLRLLAGKHATAHHAVSGHPLVSSFEPGEAWWWCFVDATVLSVGDAPTFSHP